ncbi:protein of unknown function [Paraburkholderia dioscoreae]|uniref:Lysozyme n=2 Tax=Paraburkholderia dioscoreae TaxID=2604047 RepID=A0A5Q4Z9L1_9BURK|nr:protein of unknown function [Paraburkholderia dioscoreae]
MTNGKGCRSSTRSLFAFGCQEITTEAGPVNIASKQPPPRNLTAEEHQVHGCLRFLPSVHVRLLRGKGLKSRQGCIRSYARPCPSSSRGMACTRAARTHGVWRSQRTPDDTSERLAKPWHASDRVLPFLAEWESGSLNGVVRIFYSNHTHHDYHVTNGMILTVYNDDQGNPTVGCGHLVVPADHLHAGDTITLERGQQLLRADLVLGRPP